MASRSSTFGASLGGLITVAVVGAIVWFVWTQARPKGERVGEIDLVHPAPFVFEATGGTTLIFRLDYNVLALRNANVAVPDEDKIIDRALGASTLHITLEEANGTRSRTLCPTFEGTSASRSQEGMNHLRSGVPVTCRLDVTTSGRARLEAEVAWDQSLRSREAKLEVRRESRDTKEP